MKSMRKMFELATLILITTALSVGCAEEAEVIEGGSDDEAGLGGKGDSGWLASDSFEVNALVNGSVRYTATGEWADLESDTELQVRLIDLQLKFIKTTAESYGWRFNQLADTVDVVAVDVDGDEVTLKYVAVVDMLGRLRGSVPRLDELDPRVFDATVPVVPADFAYADMSACSKTDADHSVRDYNFHYYFAPEKEGCELELNKANLEITEVFDRPIAYPEYDQLMQPLDEETVGFFAALVPNKGDNDPMSRFDAHARMLENELGLEGIPSEDGSYTRYTWREDGTAIVIDLFDPTQVSWSTGFDTSFRERLGNYTFVHYNGHSSSGSKHLLDHPEACSDAYQIISMHSCQSYAYYTRQVFRGKATDDDPSGFANADVIATGKSSYPGGSPPTLRVLFQSFMAGMRAIHRGEPEAAPDWITISANITGATWGDILYGVAGVRTNAWRP